ncbi:hypothetical protein F5Y13DRAFT_195948 [Hypoxylon sp. FL1857]|nr:hypothetical protein F5Y13DRAFT_195948 [Hypoxylon sp. FL1857]
MRLQQKFVSGLIETPIATLYALGTLSSLVTLRLLAVIGVNPDSSSDEPVYFALRLYRDSQHRISATAIDVSLEEVRPGALTSSRGSCPTMTEDAKLCSSTILAVADELPSPLPVMDRGEMIVRLL